MAVRSAVHQAGAAALTELLQFPVPAADQRIIPLDLPMVVGAPIPILYVPMDVTGVPVVRKETVCRGGHPHAHRSSRASTHLYHRDASLRRKLSRLMKLLGHTSPDMTMIYLDIALSDLQRRLRVL